ncbi:MAG: ATP-NAD kinase family protein [Desulfurococcales archaeon]|nr:ATP-NAD kinase family protein [Desulfurococcales archaeon]
MARVGVIVNPVAGLGGRLGFKGTDGAIALRALMLSEELVSPKRAREFFENLRPGPLILVPPGKMGEESVKGTPHRYRVVGCVGRRTWPTVAADTRRCARMMVDEGVDLIVFVGGDGTARDISSSIDMEVPVVGVPSGVKSYSAVFAVNPRAAARVVEEFLESRVSLVKREVLDVDEDAFRRDELVVRLYGYLVVPESEHMVGGGKEVVRYSEDEVLDSIAEYVVELMEDCTLYILGPGYTVSRIAERLGVEKTVLGVDAVHNGVLVGKDLDEDRLLELASRYDNVKVVVSPLGGQGFILGRGNQQISPRLLSRLGKDDLIVVSSPLKLRRLKVLRVDTGDPGVDEKFRGYVRVITGYGRYSMVRVE